MPAYFTINKALRDISAGENGLLKPVNGVNGIPLSVAPGFPDLEDQFNQMGITYIRLHDAYGIGDLDNFMEPGRAGNQDQLLTMVPDYQKNAAAKLVADLGNRRTIFPHAAQGMRMKDLDLALSEANYAMTDDYLRKILQNNPNYNPRNIQRDVMFRIGRSLDGGYELPQDFSIYAELVGKLVERYSRDYAATGLPRKIQYWEIWNEPDLTFFWNNGNPDVYYDFYSTVARKIKSIDPTAKVGGPGAAFGYNPGGAYLDGLLDHCRSSGTPIDFLSWHFYADSTADPQDILDTGRSIQRTLNVHGYSDVESICTEWNSTPYSSANNFTKVQSAKNAAFIVACLNYMQYSKVDKAYYYRGDALSFGLFNDQENPVWPGHKSFCTYSAQAFSLFARMFETPHILVQDRNLSTGISYLACENDAGNRINVLVSNFKVEKYFFDANQPPRESGLYGQHYLDANRSIEQLNDSWSLNEWFGNVDPTTIHPDNSVAQNKTVQAPPVYGSVQEKSRTYVESDNGVFFTIKNINYRTADIKAFRIREGGDLSSLTPPDATYDLNAVSLSDNRLTFEDTRAAPSTVTLYTIDLSDTIGIGGGGIGDGGIGNGGFGPGHDHPPHHWQNGHITVGPKGVDIGGNIHLR